MAKPTTDVESTQPKPFIFVLMPFETAFDPIYDYGIKLACKSAGGHCERVDEQQFEGSILAHIYNQIAKADLIVADMTKRNPNVFYEVGYAHALGKHVLLITQEVADIPFDLKHYHHVEYRGDIPLLKKELTKRVRWYLANPTTPTRVELSAVEFYLGGKPLASEPTIDCVPLLLDNIIPLPSQYAQAKSDYKIAFSIGAKNTAPERIQQRCQVECYLPSGIPVGNGSGQIIQQTIGNLVIVDVKLDILPGGWQAIPITLYQGVLIPARLRSEEKATVKVLIRTDLGVQEYYFELRYLKYHIENISRLFKKSSADKSARGDDAKE